MYPLRLLPSLLTKPMLPVVMSCLLLLSSCGSMEKSLKRGDAAWALGEYAEAAGQYRKAYLQCPAKDKPRRGAISYKMGTAYRRYGNVARALGAFSTAVRFLPEDSLSAQAQAEALMHSGRYADAIKAYTALVERYPDSAILRRGLTAALQAERTVKAGSAYTVRMASKFNGSRSDYAPAYVGQEAEMLCFTTTRQKVKGEDLSGITGMKNGDIYLVKKNEQGQWEAPAAVEGELNSNDDEGTPSFTPDGKEMYLTVCRTDPEYPRMAEIWKSVRSDASWSKPQPVTVTADTLSSYAHPAVSPDQRWLYFTSDMPGGYGGLDLWRMPLDAKHGGGAVENLGPDINTEGDECFPAFRPDGELYFAASGRADCLGGLDLYRARHDSVADRWTVEHLPAPMNSFGDDFGITFEGLHNRGYFSSNRSTGGRGWDKLFEFSYPEVLQTVKGWVYEQDGYELPEAVVYMIGDDGTNEKVSVLSDGSFEKPLKAGVRYLFLATAPTHLNVSAELRADTVEVEKQHVVNFPLPPIRIPVLVRNVFYEFDKAELTDNSREALDRLTNMLNENPNITIELSAHCDYRGNDDYNLRLSQRRAESVVNYLTEHGIAPDRLTPKGYGEERPKIVNKKLIETYPFLHEGDTLTLDYILKLTPEQQEVCNSLNRRTEFRVLRTTYGLLDDKGNLKQSALKPEATEATKADYEAQ